MEGAGMLWKFLWLVHARLRHEEFCLYKKGLPLLSLACFASPLFRIFEIFGIFTFFTPRTLSELASSDRFPSMSEPALPPNPPGGPPTTPTNPFAPSRSMTQGRGRSVLVEPRRPPQTPIAPAFESAQKRQRS